MLGFLGFKLKYDYADMAGWSNGKTLFWIAAADAQGKKHKYRKGDIGFHHYAFELASRKDVDALGAFLEEHGMNVVDPPGEYYGDRYYAVYFTDPDGMKLEGMVYKPPPKTAAGEKEEVSALLARRARAANFLSTRERRAIVPEKDIHQNCAGRSTQRSRWALPVAGASRPGRISHLGLGILLRYPPCFRPVLYRDPHSPNVLGVQGHSGRTLESCAVRRFNPSTARARGQANMGGTHGQGSDAQQQGEEEAEGGLEQEEKRRPRPLAVRFGTGAAPARPEPFAKKS